MNTKKSQAVKFLKEKKEYYEGKFMDAEEKADVFGMDWCDAKITVIDSLINDLEEI